MYMKFLGLLGLFLSTVVAAEVGQMSADELAARLDETEVVILDVRTSTSWRFSDQKIKSAVRVDHQDIPRLSSGYERDTTLVLYCD